MPFKSDDALIIVDPQIDFFPGGSLPVPDGDAILASVNMLIDQSIKNEILIVFTRDWHPQNHCSFKPQGGPFPAHCIQDTKGAEFHPDLTLPDVMTVISKAYTPNIDTFSGFQGGITEDKHSLFDVLELAHIKRVFLAGLTLEYCVKATALDAKQAGYETHVVLPGTRPITDEAGEAAKEELKKAGIILEEQMAF